MTGHLFILHGRIESLLHDAALIPSDDAFSIRSYWAPIVGDRPVKPSSWDRLKWGQLGERVWALSIGGSFAAPYEEILERATAALTEIAHVLTGVPPQGGRLLPLVAMPFIGLGGTGYGGSRGLVIKDLLGWASVLAEDLGIDLALVTPNAAVYAAAQVSRRERLVTPDPDAVRLGALARSGGLALLTGAGVGIPAGLPSWHVLVDKLAAGVQDLDPKSIEGLSAIDQAELIERLDGEDFQARVASIIREAENPSILHVLLAGLDVREVVTTNYDTLYEQAVTQTGRAITTVLPWSSGYASERWILKLHGDVEHEDQIVLTRRHMVRYDAANRPSGSVLQALLLTRHLLMVGVSLTDDNVIRLAHEVQAYREDHGQPNAPFGTLLAVSRDAVRGRLWAGQLEWVTMPGPETADRARALELFLDEVALHASDESAWLLDERFSGLLATDEDRSIASDVRRLHARLVGDRWEGLRTALEQYGAS